MRIVFLFLMSLSLAFSIERPRQEDYAACYERNKASVLSYEGMQAFALRENLLAVIKTPNQKLNKYVKYDPFLNLYLVRTDFSLFPAKTNDEQNLTRNDWVGIIDPNVAYIGHLKYLAQNLNERDQVDFKTKVGQLDDCCCLMIGISLENGAFIGNRYLNHFAKYNDVYWGDIGVDFALRDNKIYVQNIRNNGQFLINDEIVSVDDVPYDDLRKLNEKILFADRESTLYFKILRDNKDVNISTRVFAKDLNEARLQNFGPSFDANKNKKPAPSPNYRTSLGLSITPALIVSRVEAGSKAALAGFRAGDKILRLNNKEIRDLKTLQSTLAAENTFDVLIARKSSNLPLANKQNQGTGDGIFQFFIRLTK